MPASGYVRQSTKRGESFFNARDSAHAKFFILWWPLDDTNLQPEDYETCWLIAKQATSTRIKLKLRGSYFFITSK